MNATQCRMARAALQLGVRELAALARVSTSTLTKFERGEALMPRTAEAIQRALEAKGIIFTSNPPGVTIGEYPLKKRRATDSRATDPRGKTHASDP
jgi:transcriptional regulator with XRE-family HTH domain